MTSEAETKTCALTCSTTRGCAFGMTGIIATKYSDLS